MEKFALAFGPPSVSDTATGKGLSRASEDGGLQKLEAERSLSNRILPIAARRMGISPPGSG